MKPGELLRKIQNSDDSAKGKIMLLASAVLILIAVLLWIWYMSGVVNSLIQGPRSEVDEEGFSFTQTIGQGAKVAGQSVLRGFGKAAALFIGPKDVTVNPE